VVIACREDPYQFFGVLRFVASLDWFGCQQILAGLRLIMAEAGQIHIPKWKRFTRKSVEWDFIFSRYGCGARGYHG